MVTSHSHALNFASGQVTIPYYGIICTVTQVWKVKEGKSKWHHNNMQAQSNYCTTRRRSVTTNTYDSHRNTAGNAIRKKAVPPLPFFALSHSLYLLFISSSISMPPNTFCLPTMHTSYQWYLYFPNITSTRTLLPSITWGLRATRCAPAHAFFCTQFAYLIWVRTAYNIFAQNSRLSIKSFNDMKSIIRILIVDYVKSSIFMVLSGITLSRY